MRRVLMIAYHFPPMAGGSGIQRTLRFVQHLPSCGWEPLVLTVHPRAYERTGSDLLREVPEGVVVHRAFALDTARHLSVAGRYFGSMARPDRWVSWRLGAIPEGLRMIRQYKPDVIWSTYPIATAHSIAAELHARTKLPWIADFRDPMAQDGYPSDPKTWKSFKRIEESAVHGARYSVFTTPGAVRMYRQRYPEAADRIVLLENGYDEESFTGITARQPLVPGAVVLLHSGIVYPEERDPRPLFVALARLKEAGVIQPENFRLRFRAALHEALLRGLAQEHGLDAFVEICPPVGYREALEEMMRADALLVMQSSGCNDQIPAKIYEYLRANRPILGLADPGGDTAGVMRNAGLEAIARLDSADEIEQLLPRFLNSLREGSATLPLRDAVERSSRRGRTASLLPLLEAAASGGEIPVVRARG
ncbi:MAG: glycosyltransferase [Rhodocyclaceae bacterium]|nr:glycosyltransferase [Rhodocyclaceae bacterium]